MVESRVGLKMLHQDRRFRRKLLCRIVARKREERISTLERPVPGSKADTRLDAVNRRRPAAWGQLQTPIIAHFPPFERPESDHQQTVARPA